MRRLRFALAASAMVVLAPLSGCAMPSFGPFGAGEPTSALNCSESATLPSPRPSEVNDPMILAFDRDLTAGVRQKLVDCWNRHFPHHPARIVELPDGTDLARSQLVAALQSGSGGYDVVNMDVTWTAEFATQGLIEEWPDELDGDFIDSVEETVRTPEDGRVWGVPFNTDAALLYYRKDILEAEEIDAPRSWNELDTASVLIQDKRDIYGFTSQLKEYEGLTVNVLEAVREHGGDLPARDAEAEEGVEKGLRALWQRQRDPKGEKRRPLMHPESDSAGEEESVRAFAEGEAVFMRNWPVAYERLASTMDDFEDRVEVAKLPWDSVLGGQNLAVTSGADDKGWARRLVTFLTSEKSERCLLEYGFAATRESAYDKNRSIRCDLPDSDARGGEKATPSRVGLPPSKYGMLRAAIKDATARPVTPHYPAFTRKVQAGGRMALEEGAEEAADLLRGELGAAMKGR